jgi:hypothetical protein
MEDVERVAWVTRLTNGEKMPNDYTEAQRTARDTFSSITDC